MNQIDRISALMNEELQKIDSCEGLIVEMSLHKPDYKEDRESYREWRAQVDEIQFDRFIAQAKVRMFDELLNNCINPKHGR